MSCGCSGCNDYTGCIYKEPRDGFEIIAKMILNAALLYAEVEGMKAFNKERELNGLSLAYSEGAFYEVMEKYKNVT